jgi:dienelactone hydrolase
MFRAFFLTCFILFSGSTSLSAPQNAALLASQSLPVGKVIEHVTCAKHPEQSYALYLPYNYSARSSWPIIYSFDPAARGSLPVELQREAAERYGYILAASNNSKNGPWKPEAEAAEAMMDDTQTRFSVDAQRIYFAGFSGGARLASQLATLCKCAAGILLSGAGFSPGNDPAKDISFAVFSAVGTLDFNYRELIPLQAKLVAAGHPHWLRTFDGPHEWAPEEVMDEALAWFRIQSMKCKLVPQDDAFLHDQFAKAEARANSFAQLQDVLNAYREYTQIAATYNLLLDVSASRAKADALGNEKPFRDAAKQESRDFEQQDQLTRRISSALSEAPTAPANDSPSTLSAEEQVRQLRERAEQEKQPKRAIVLKRALAGVFIEAMELGNDALDHKNFPLAVRAYRSAAQASPQSEWAWESVAVAQASAGARKEAFNAISRAREHAKDKHGFAEWLKTEPAFDRFRSSPEFQSLQKLQ